MSFILDLASLAMNDVCVRFVGRQIEQDWRTTSEAVESGLPLLIALLARHVRGHGTEVVQDALETPLVRNVLTDVVAYAERPDWAQRESVLVRSFPTHEAARAVLCETSGLDRRQASMLLATLAPVVLAAVAKALRRRSLHMSEIGSLLDGEDRWVSRRSPGLIAALRDQLDNPAGDRESSEESGTMPAQPTSRPRTPPDDPKQ